MKNLFLWPLLFLLLGCTSVRPPVRIVCIGDSLTSCGGPGGRYTDWLAAWLPDAEIINKGIGGNTLAQGRARYQRDVLDLNPDVVVIELGACDFWRGSRSLDELASELEYMVSVTRFAGIQVIIASCFGGTQNAPLPECVNDMRAAYGRGIASFERNLCERYGCYYVPNMQVDIKPAKDFPQYWGDNRHPNKAGNEQVARRIFDALKSALATIDADF